RRRHTRSARDWSSDVCSSDLGLGEWGLTKYAAPNLLLGNGIYALEGGKKIGHRGLPPDTDLATVFKRLRQAPAHETNVTMKILEIGRASCRESEKSQVQ